MEGSCPVRTRSANHLSPRRLHLAPDGALTRHIQPAARIAEPRQGGSQPSLMNTPISRHGGERLPASSSWRFEMKLIAGVKLISSAAIALAAAVSTGAHADSISITGSLSLVEALTFTPSGTALQISSPGLFGAAFYGPDTGVAIFGPTNFTTEPLTPGQQPGDLSFFPITSPAATQTFQYTATIDPDNLGPD